MSTYKWLCTMSVFLDLSYTIEDYAIQFHPFSCKLYDIFIFNSSIIFHCVDVPHFFFCYSVERRLGFFQFLGIANKAAMNIVDQGPLGYSGAYFGIYPGVLYVGLGVVLFQIL